MEFRVPAAIFILLLIAHPPWRFMFVPEMTKHYQPPGYRGNKRARKPRTSNELTRSPYHPHIPADRPILRWTAPWSKALDRRRRGKHIDDATQAKIYQVLLLATTEGTRESYGAGLLRFHQYCDARGIEEESRMPADLYIVMSFVATAITVLAPLQPRDMVWEAPSLARELKKGGDQGGIEFKHPPLGPVTIA
ncbi:hypothetical protein K438DRAFT_2011098 [Mycena galopus ATCC 62051]|nr:hypothetical protein K438DRAFT_2011098 [Mycena galopus ATCC 62051]